MRNQAVIGPIEKNWDWWVERLLEFGLMVFGFFVMVAQLNHILEYLFFTLFGIWVIRALVTRKFQVRRTPVDIPLFCFLSWVPITFLTSLDPHYSFSEWRKTLAHVLMLYFVVHIVRREEQVVRILRAILAGVLFVAVISVFQYFAMGWSPFDMSVRGYSLTSESQWMSTYLIMCVPLFWFGWHREIHRGFRWSYVAGIVLVLCGIFLSHTRSAWLTLFIIIAVYFTMKVFQRGVLIIGGALLLVIVMMFTLAQSDQVRHVLLTNQFTNPITMMLRFKTWNTAVMDIRESPFMGIGYGKHTFGKKHPDAEEQNFHTHIHNMFISKAVQVGIPGFLLFSWIFASILMTTVKTWQKTPDNVIGQFSLAIFLMTLAVIIRNFFDDMFIGTLAYLFWLLVGLQVTFALSHSLMNDEHEQGDAV